MNNRTEAPKAAATERQGVCAAKDEPAQLSLLDQPPVEPELVRHGTEGRPGFDDHGFPLEYRAAA